MLVRAAGSGSVHIQSIDSADSGSLRSGRGDEHLHHGADGGSAVAIPSRFDFLRAMVDVAGNPDCLGRGQRSLCEEQASCPGFDCDTCFGDVVVGVLRRRQHWWRRLDGEPACHLPHYCDRHVSRNGGRCWAERTSDSHRRLGCCLGMSRAVVHGGWTAQYAILLAQPQ